MTDLARKLQRVYVLLDDGERRALTTQQVTTTQYAMLRTLADGPPEGLPVSRLAERMLCTRGNISRVVVRLENAGLVRTGSHGEDQRLVLVRLTDQGHTALRRAREAVAAADRRRFAGLDTDELRTLSILVDRLTTTLAADLDR
ncbi:transcriptional regulator, MarR family [Austwickia chelonae]|uniref:Putative transcriptional regulator n=1 Tax=Austwickia chelonae NBRC 105200 TaxID=1184607 RepID=K6W7U1_9MICO|nr:MarR family transcriptional regulator [Austwickia chelonae]GAB77902.1 putative transcriptional regulator [Austwickia chelonae NBRC 105200]SEV91864.1 transcriptional regulator, MarR family [Austwickia chelonae]